MSRFSIQKFTGLALVLFAMLGVSGCDFGSGTNTGSTDISEVSSNSNGSNIIIVEKKSSSSAAGSTYCVSINGNEMNCGRSLSLFRTNSAAVSPKSSSSYSPKGYFLDSRYNRLYRTVRLGNQVWLAENVNVDGEEHFDAVKARFACPDGSHLPTASEWEQMMLLYTEAMEEEDGTYYISVGTMLKSTDEWLGRDNGTNELLFDAKPAGYTLSGETYSVGHVAYFWTSSAWNTDSTFGVRIVENDNYVVVEKRDNEFGMSVRCVVDGSANVPQSSSSSDEDVVDAEVMPAGTYSCSEYDCVTDEFLLDDWDYMEVLDSRDNKVYKVVALGLYYYLAQNLDYEMDDSYCGYMSVSDISCEDYGRMYKWDEAIKACPAGWRLPDVSDYKNIATEISDTETYESLAYLSMGRFSPPSIYLMDSDGSTSFWTSSEYTISSVSNFSYVMTTFAEKSNEKYTQMDAASAVTKNYYMPIRCVRDAK